MVELITQSLPLLAIAPLLTCLDIFLFTLVSILWFSFAELSMVLWWHLKKMLKVVQRVGFFYHVS